MKRKFTRLCTMLLAVIMTASLCLPMGGCESNPEPNSELNIDVPPWQEDVFTGAIAAYKIAYPDVTVNVTYHRDITVLEGTVADDAEEAYYAAYRMNLMAGKGPDVIYGLNQNLDLYKVMQAGAFADLTELMEDDSDFNPADYDQTALDACKFQGKQLVMPLSCYPRFFVTTQRILDETGFDIESASKDWLTFMEAAKAYAEESGDSIPFFNSCEYSTMLYIYLPYAAIPYINYEEKSINSEYETEIKRVADVISFFDSQSLNFVSLPAGATDTMPSMLYGNRVRLSDSLGGSTLLTYLSQMVGQGESPVFIPLRSFDGKSVFKIGGYASINNASPNKQNAWNFIKLLANQAAQSGNAMNVATVPVLMSARKAASLPFRQGVYDIPYKLPPMNEQIEALFDQYDEFILNFDGAFLSGMDGCTKFFELAKENNLDPVKDYDKAVELLERYLSE